MIDDHLIKLGHSKYKAEADNALRQSMLRFQAALIYEHLRAEARMRDMFRRAGMDVNSTD